MSDNQTKNSNELKTTNQIINEQIKKIEQDTRDLINRTIDGQPAQVSVVKVSNNKIIIEVDLNNFKFDTTSIEPNQETNTNKINQSKKTDPLSIATKSIAQPDDDQSPENQDDKPTLKGILKYSNNWKKRTLSSSSEFDNSSSFTDHEDFDDLSLSCNDLDVLVDKSSNSKKVTFNKQINKKLFSKNQRTIESRPKKKKNKNNKKAKSNDDQKKSNECANDLNAKANESMKDDLSTNKVEDVTVDELSFLVCSSDSETGMLFGSVKSEGDSKTTKLLEEDILDQQIDHCPNDKENWSEVKSSKKVKKNRKRNDSGNSIDETPDQTNVELIDSLTDKASSSLASNANITALTASKNAAKNSGKTESCDQQSSVRSKQMSLGIKNLEIQVN